MVNASGIAPIKPAIPDLNEIEIIINTLSRDRSSEVNWLEITIPVIVYSISLVPVYSTV